MKILYISDLHLEFLRENYWESRYTKNMANRPAKESLEELAIRFVNEANKHEYDTILVAGDTTGNIDDTTRFLQLVDKLIDKPLIFTLGNHDFWWNYASSFTKKMPRKMSVEEQEDYVDEAISFCPNLIFLKAGRTWHEGHVTFIGDCGFAAKHPSFNANAGIYRDALTWAKELELTERWKIFYSNYCHSFGKDRKPEEKLVVMTHMPSFDWDGYEIAEDWAYYICGHIHDVDQRISSDVKIRVTSHHKGDAGNGYYTDKIDFKLLEI